MAQRRTRSSRPSCSYFYEDFTSQAQETNYNLHYFDREIFISHYLDEDLFKNLSFMEAFTIIGLDNFVFEKP